MGGVVDDEIFGGDEAVFGAFLEFGDGFVDGEVAEDAIPEVFEPVATLEELVVDVTVFVGALALEFDDDVVGVEVGFVEDVQEGADVIAFVGVFDEFGV